MRVTFFVNNYAPSKGGVQQHVGRVAEGLAEKHSMSVSVLTTDAILAPAGPHAGRISAGDEVLEGVEVLRRPVARRLHSLLRALRRIGRRAGVYEPGRNTMLITGPLGLRIWWSARRLARRSDVVVGVGAPSAMLWAAGRLTRSDGCALVAMPLLHLDGEQRRWVLDLVRRAEAVSANSPVEGRWLEERGVDRRRLHVLPPGCEPTSYPDSTPAESRARAGLVDLPTVGFVGRLAPHKGVDVLIEAMRSLWTTRPDVQLLLAGHAAGWDLDAALAKLSDADRDRVRVWGGFSDEDRPMLLSACDVVAHPSRSESFGMVTLEAWCASRPVVVGDIDVTRELVRDGVDGYLVDPGSAGEIADRLGRLLGDDELRGRMGRAGRERAVAEYSWDTVIDRWARMLDDLSTMSGAEAA